MGSKRESIKYDVHCMDCGRSYERRFVPDKCTFRCGSRNIIVEENSKYILENIFPGKERTYIDYTPIYSLNLEGML